MERECSSHCLYSPSKSSTVQFASLGRVVVFMYLPDEDSVLLVDADAYKSCNVWSHIDDFNDGNPVFTFTRSSDFYCDKNEKLHVVVRHGKQAEHGLLPGSPVSTTIAGVEEPSVQSSRSNEHLVLGALSGALSLLFEVVFADNYASEFAVGEEVKLISNRKALNLINGKQRTNKSRTEIEFAII